MSSVRAQVHFTSEQIAALRRLAAKQNRSIADIVRECVDQYVARTSTSDRQALVKRAKEATGSFASGKSDVSERHDDYLADAYR